MGQIILSYSVYICVYVLSFVSINNFWFITMNMIQYIVEKPNIGPAVIRSYSIGNKTENIKADIQFTIVGIVKKVGYDI